jgi:hypothetical protein
MMLANAAINSVTATALQLSWNSVKQLSLDGDGKNVMMQEQQELLYILIITI